MLIFNQDTVREPLYVVVPYQNWQRWKSRVKHTQRALKHFHDIGATIILVEIAFNRREFEFAGSGLDGTLTNCDILSNGAQRRHRHIQLRTTSELWLKENAINIGVERLTHEIDREWQQVAWFDSDIHFLRPNIVGEIIHKLQQYSFVQPFTHARDLAPNYELLDEDYPHADGVGFVHAWQNDLIKSSPNPIIEQDIRDINLDLKRLEQDVMKLEHDLIEGQCYGKIDNRRVWPGLAMCCTRQAWEAVGGLIDEAIWSGGDWWMSHCLIEKTEGMMWPQLHRNLQKIVMQWYHRCRCEIRQNVGVVSGTVVHHWHGRKPQRGYNKKHILLAEVGFDPPRHLKKDAAGLWNLHDDRTWTYPKLRDMMRKIAVERNEDSPET